MVEGTHASATTVARGPGVLLVHDKKRAAELWAPAARVPLPGDWWWHEHRKGGTDVRGTIVRLWG